MFKVATLIGTRPEIIRLSRIIAKLDEYFDHHLVHTGQNFDYELNETFFHDLNIRAPDYYLNCAADTPAATIGKVIERFDDYLAKQNPSAVLILGDTNSALGAIAAKRRKIPIFHMEAGNRCFDQRVPEEINRKIVDHISDINIPYSSIARDYLLNEGIPAETVIKSGSPMFEVIDYYREKIESSDVLEDLNLTAYKYFVVSAHREENVDNPKQLHRLVDILNQVSDLYEIPIVFSAHPRTRKIIDKQGLSFHEKVKLVRPLPFTAYAALQSKSKAVLSDSGTITEESSILNFRALNIREAHERPEGFEEGAVMFTGLHPTRVLQALEIVIKQSAGPNRELRLVSDYDAPNVSEKIARIIMSYTDFINRKYWRKEL